MDYNRHYDMDATADAEHNGSMDLRQHSLYSIVRQNKLLWMLPAQWTLAHLQALRVYRRSHTYVAGIDQDGPSEPAPFLSRGITVIIPGPTEAAAPTAGTFHNVLAFPSPSAEPVKIDIAVDVVGDRPSNTQPVVFYGQQCHATLAVGRCEYPVPPLFSCRFGPLELPYLDGAEIISVARSYLSHKSYEPCIVAVLIAMAQDASTTADGPGAIRTRLLFTHYKGHQYMHIYTAHVSQALLYRFRHPSQPPAGVGPDTPVLPTPLLTLYHLRVPYKPYDTFRRRTMDALSTSDSIEYKTGSWARQKRKPSNVRSATDKRRQQEPPRTP